MDILTILYSRSGMYLPSYEQKIDASSFFTSFLSAILGSQEWGWGAESIYIMVAGHCFSIQAIKCTIPMFDLKVENLSDVFDIANFRKPFFDSSYSLGLIRPIIWFSDYCLIDVPIIGKVLRQAFLRGTPLGEQSQIQLNDRPPFLGFLFTLPIEPFKEVTLGVERLRKVIDIWEKQNLTQLSSTQNKRMILHKQWCEQSEYHYSLKITPEVPKKSV